MSATHEHGCKFIEEMKNAGLLPEHTRRIVIDIKYDDTVSVYYETIGTATIDDIMVKEILPLIKDE